MHTLAKGTGKGLRNQTFEDKRVKINLNFQNGGFHIKTSLVGVRDILWNNNELVFMMNFRRKWLQTMHNWVVHTDRTYEK